MASSSLRRIFWWVLRGAASAVLLWLVMRQLHLPTVERLFREIRWGWLAVAFGIILINRGLSVLRFLLMLRAKGVAFDEKAVARIVLGSEFYGAFLPSSVGADSIRLYSLMRHTGDTTESVSAVLLERALGVVALLLFGCVGALWIWGHVADHRIIKIALIPSMVGLLAAAVLNERWLSALIRWAGLHQHRWVAKLLEWRRAVRAYREHPQVMAKAFVVSLGILFFRVASVYCSARALGAPIPFAYFMAFIPLILLISLLPISIGGFGVRENAFIACFSQVGVAPAVAFSVSILAHVLSVVGNVPGGLWSLWGTGRVMAGESRS